MWGWLWPFVIGMAAGTVVGAALLLWAQVMGHIVVGGTVTPDSTKRRLRRSLLH